MKTIKVCVTSDLHGSLPNIPECDLLLICGDIVPLNVQSTRFGTENFFRDTFKRWANNLPVNKVLFIAGNHELQFQKRNEFYSNLFPKFEKVTYLYNEEYEYKGLKIYGTPYTHKFYNWAFMKEGEALKNIYDQIPYNLDILITHEQPKYFGDIILQEDCRWYNGEHIGCKELLDAILEKQPKYQFNGHIHTGDHNLIKILNTNHYNVSLKDETYIDHYKPLLIDIPIQN